jgi:hypothetical protein
VFSGPGEHGSQAVTQPLTPRLWAPASAHGPRWSSQYAMSRDEERQFLLSAREMVEAATGQRPSATIETGCGAVPIRCPYGAGLRLPISTMSAAMSRSLNASTARTSLSCPTRCAATTLCSSRAAITGVLEQIKMGQGRRRHTYARFRNNFSDSENCCGAGHFPFLIALLAVGGEAGNAACRLR